MLRMFLDSDLFLNYHVRHLNLFKPWVGLKSKEQAAGFKPTTFDGKHFCSQSSSPPHQATNINPKGCLSLFNYFIDMSPTHMSPFFVERTCLFPSKTCFFDKKWTHMGGAHIYKIIK